TLVLLINLNIRPIIRKMAGAMATNIYTQTINEVISAVMSENNYQNITKIISDEEGNIKAIETDIVKINLLKTNILKNLTTEVKKYQTEEIKVPLGSLLHNEFLSGKGPLVPFKIISVGYIEAEFENKFEDAGINQTVHQIMLKLNLKGSAIIPLLSANINITYSYPITETVIVGDVPNSFTEVVDSRDNLSKINDYKSN
ncbi:MAG: sporulation protein YunB, partial [Oscillospiraceae bacterium]|nr:sporulation protein YunB [Oscillospiraceae bacterium]